MHINIRKVRREDLATIVRLSRDFAKFEDLSNDCEITEERLDAAMFGQTAFVEGTLAFDGEKPIAYALFYPNFASFRGQRGFYLEDIFVLDDYRGKGVGEEILKEIARLAKVRGFERIDFQVLDWNLAAIAFYEKFGAVRDEDERHFKFVGDGFQNLAP